ncbi:MAG: energy transducer TonB [Deltaproteobacteria bacterium]|nr:energy transducer TonB [Deltaproteobacteria bacterium]
MIFFRVTLISLFIHLAIAIGVSAWKWGPVFKSSASSIEQHGPQVTLLIVSGAMESHAAKHSVPPVKKQKENFLENKLQEKPQPQSGKDAHDTAQNGEGTSGTTPFQGDSLYEKYLKQVQQKIVRRRNYPADAKQMGIEGKVLVLLVINREGQLVHYKVLKSDHELLSNGALQTIKNASPFPPLPEHLANTELKIAVPITYHISEMDT